MWRLLLILVLGVLAACAPAAQDPAPDLDADEAGATLYSRLVAPFEGELDALGIRVDSFEAYRYEGTDSEAFLQATNQFYQRNPGFCPLVEAFYPAENGLQFMTLAGDNAGNVRGFLYDQSRRPRLAYAYFTGRSSQVLPAIVCETAPAE